MYAPLRKMSDRSVLLRIIPIMFRRAMSRSLRRRFGIRPAIAWHGMACAVIALAATSSGCKPKSPPDSATQSVVVLYSSVDEAFLRRIVDDYARRDGVRVQIVGDSEAGKTTGLVNRIRLEQDRPRADVFWSSEQSQTILLAREGLLAAYDSPAAADIPKAYRDPRNLWTGFALRARVVAYDPERIDANALPTTWEGYADGDWPGRLALANPLFGTTRGHMAAMRASWGAGRFRTYLEKLVAGGVTLADGNATAVRKLIAGEVAVAFTDSDDVITARAKGARVAMVFPDMGDGGTLVIPNTVALVAGGPNPAAGRALIDYILSPQVESALARSPSGNYPVRADLRGELGIELPSAGTLGFTTIADQLAPAIADCRETLLK
jgi:iron(III) transport system substrate-binding protein